MAIATMETSFQGAGRDITMPRSVASVAILLTGQTESAAVCMLGDAGCGFKGVL